MTHRWPCTLSLLTLGTLAAVGCARREAPPPALSAPPPVLSMPPAPPAPTAAQAVPTALNDAASKVRVEVIADHPTVFAGRVVDCEIVDPLEGPATEEARLKESYPTYRVSIPDRNDVAISLVAPGFDVKDPDRYKHRLDRVLTPPLVVRGRFVADPDPELRPPQYALIVERTSPLDLGQPVRIASYDDLGKDGRFDRKLVAVSGMLEHRFEVSRIGPMWVSHARLAPGSLKPSPDPNTTVGILFAKPGAMYGHLGAYAYELVVPASQ